jgi:hypothetical protein
MSPNEKMSKVLIAQSILYSFAIIKILALDYQIIATVEDYGYTGIYLKNHIGVQKLTPIRAHKKVGGYGAYITEALLPIKRDEFEGEAGYQKFNLRIEQKVNSRVEKNDVNNITFYGDAGVEPLQLAKFEDLGLITDYETVFNDHLIGMPFSLKYYSQEMVANPETILEQAKRVYETVSTTYTAKNLLGYVPAYVYHRELEKFIQIYQNGPTIREKGESYNVVLLMVDFKRRNPDALKRQLAMLLRLKNRYLNEGFYLFYYAMNVGRPRLSEKKKSALALDFLTTLIGFDVVGSSHTSIPQSKRYGYTRKPVEFSIDDFCYHIIEQKTDQNTYEKIRANNYQKQSEFLRNTTIQLQRNPSTLQAEIEKRPEANKFIKEMLGYTH